MAGKFLGVAKPESGNATMMDAGMRPDLPRFPE
jgi:hypothetical protein